MTLWHISNIPQGFHRFEYIIIPPCFIWQQYLRNIAIQPAVGCSDLWVNIRFSSCSPLGGNNCETGLLAQTSWQLTEGCREIFHKYCCYTNMGVYNKFDSTKAIGTYCWYVKIPQREYMEHGLKDMAFYVKSHIAKRTGCYNYTLVRDKPLRAPAFVKLVYCCLNSDNTITCTVL